MHQRQIHRIWTAALLTESVVGSSASSASWTFIVATIVVVWATSRAVTGGEIATKAVELYFLHKILLGTERKGGHLIAHKALVETATVELRKCDGGSFLLHGLGVHGLLEARKSLGLDHHGHDCSLGLSLIGLDQLRIGSPGSDVAPWFWNFEISKGKRKRSYVFCFSVGEEADGGGGGA